jgi:hypothetical protein
VILDRAADLRNLAELASSTAHSSNEDAAFADVQQRVTGARSLFSALGMARVRPLLLLEADQRSEVVRAAKQLRGVLGVLAEASDAELAAYASGSADKRGSLLAVSRQAAALRGVLLAAQQALLRRLAGEIWPDDELVRLDVISHLSDNPSAAQAGRRAQEVHAQLLERAIAADVGMPFDELEQLIEQASRAAEDARPLRDESVPEDVIEFWEKASDEYGAGLDALTPEVRAWLDTHDALASFTVSRNRWR